MWVRIQIQKKKNQNLRSIFLAIALSQGSQATESSTHDHLKKTLHLVVLNTVQGNYSEYRALCRYPNLQLYASLWKAFLVAIVSSFILALPSFCLDFNTAEILISHLLVAPSYALVSLNTHPRGSFLEGKRRNTQTCLHHSISQRELSL